MRKYFVLFIIVIFTTLSVAQTRYIAKTEKSTLNKIGITTSKTLAAEQWQVFSVTDTSRLVELRQAGIYVELDRQSKISSVPNDNLFNLQWGLTGNNNLWRGDFSDAWKITEGNKNVRVGIIDTGSPLKDGTWTHPDLDSARFSSISFVTTESDSDNTVTDYSGHGTHIAGIIAATKNNKIGVVGIDQYCKINIYKVFSKYGYGWNSDIAQAIYRAVHDSCKVLSMSFGGSFYSRIMEEAINYAQENGVVCIIASGNSSAETNEYPAFFGKFSTNKNYREGFPNVISVGAINDFGSVSNYSNRGWFVDIFAPGGSGVYPFADHSNILSTFPTYGCELGKADFNRVPVVPEQRDYGYLAGTSMATPFVTGTASLMLAANPNLKASDIRIILIRTADVIMTVNGAVAILNPGAAVQAAKNGWITSVEETNQIAENFELHQNYPNPFNPTTNIKFDLPKESDVTLKVYNIIGEEIVTLVNKVMPAGNQEVTFDASDLASGMYIYRITAGNFVQSKKMILLK